jgi:hypothetical protein
MIWKSLLAGFLLNPRKPIKLFTHRRAALFAEPLPESMSQFLETNNLTAILAKPYNRRSHKLYSGLDGRFNETDIDHELLYDISISFYKYKLLKTLENEDISVFTKLEIIETYNSENEISKLAPNMEAGGLWKDWMNDIV